MNIVEHVFGAQKYRATLVPGKHIIVELLRGEELVSVRRFEVGDEAEYDPLNLHYIAPISAIGKATVTFDTAPGHRKRLTAADFAWCNWNFNLATRRRNTETSQST